MVAERGRHAGDRCNQQKRLPGVEYRGMERVLTLVLRRPNDYDQIGGLAALRYDFLNSVTLDLVPYWRAFCRIGCGPLADDALNRLRFLI